MTNQHPITPPRELLDKWNNLPLSTEEIFVIVAQWGSDQELEACCEWLNGGSKIDYDTAALLRAARRPKPPSLKEQALKDLTVMTTVPPGMDPLSPETTERISRIRRALEALPE